MANLAADRGEGPLAGFVAHTAKISYCHDHGAQKAGIIPKTTVRDTWRGFFSYRLWLFTGVAPAVFGAVKGTYRNRPNVNYLPLENIPGGSAPSHMQSSRMRQRR